MGAALTYARRYALFAMVGIAGEDDLDASDLPAPSEAKSRTVFTSGPNARGMGKREAGLPRGANDRPHYDLQLLR